MLQNFVGAFVFFHSLAEKPVLNVAALSHNLCHCRKIQFVQNVLSFFPEPYSQYKIWIKAYTAKNEGKSSDPLLVRTDVRAPG